MLDASHVTDALQACAQIVDAFANGGMTIDPPDVADAAGAPPSDGGPDHSMFCARHDGARTHHAAAVDDVVRYPLREVEAATQYLVVVRSTLDKLMSGLVFAPDAASGPGASAVDDHAAPAPAAAAVGAGGGGDSGTTFVQLDHRNQRLQVLGARIEHFWGTILPPATTIVALGDAVRCDVAAGLNPFGFPDAPGLPIVVGQAALDAEVMQRGDPQTSRDIDAVSSSELMVVFRRFTQAFQLSVLHAAEQFQHVPVGSEGSAVGLEGAVFHGQMPEVRQLWHRLVRTAQELSSMGCALRSCMASKRRERSAMVGMLEHGALDDIWRPDDPDPQLPLPTSLMRLATTRLQMHRLALLVATCRALDSSGAEAAIQKIHFENDRRASIRDQDVAAAAYASRHRRSSVVPIARFEAFTATDGTTSSSPHEEGDGDGQGKPPQPRRRSLFAGITDPNAVGHQLHEECRAASHREAPQNCSIIPSTTLMDLEMIARAYGLDIPPCSMPLSKPGAVGVPVEDADPVRTAHAVEGRRRLQAIQQRARRTSTNAAMEDADAALARFRNVYATNRSDVGMITTDCVVVKRSDCATQTQLVGTVHEARVMDDVLSELQEARSMLTERTQQLMLERQRSEVLLLQLDQLQRQRQDFARRSAAAGGSINGGVDGSTTQLGGAPGAGLGVACSMTVSDEGAGSRGSSPLRCLSPVAGKEDVSPASNAGLRLVDSAVDLRLRAAREYDGSRTQNASRGTASPPASAPRQRSARGGNGTADASCSPPANKRPISVAAVGPVAKTFALLGRLDRFPQHNNLTTTIASRGRPETKTPAPLTPSDLLRVPTADARCTAVATLADDGRHSAPQRSPTARRDVSGGAALSPCAATLERQYGALFARKLRALEHHANKLVESKQEQDFWSGKKEIKAVVVPVGIDPRHARALLPPATTAMPSGYFHSASAPAGTSMKATHYGTVGQTPRHQC